MRPVVMLFLLGALAACDRGTPGAGRAQQGTAADSELTARGDTLQAASTGVELEAPRLIPGLRAQLSALGDSASGSQEGNAAAFRNLAADVVTAMDADLNRIGSPEVDRVRALGDSVMRTLGGGAGEGPEPDPDRLKAGVEQMERLIQEYQGALRASQR
ncbi:MAG TPA: hypothetical protein VEB59_03210 [Gemmatimonadales bacterium]|nr:hypothetical protein [Gemmatimonadales bacterium]